MQKVCLGVFLGAPTTGRKGKGQDWAQREIRLCWSLHEALGSPTRGSGAGVSLQSCLGCPGLPWEGGISLAKLLSLDKAVPTEG